MRDPWPVPPQAWGFVDWRHRLFSADARCSGCGESDPVVFVLGRDPIVCLRCDLVARCGRSTERHHFGRPPSRIVGLVDANLHRWLTIWQYGWRDRLTPGSAEAIVLDLSLWIIALCAERFRGAAA